MPWERDPVTLRMLARRLEHPDPTVRLDAVSLLAFVDCLHRRAWLESRLRDDVPVIVRRARRLLESAQAPPVDFDLLESEFAEFVGVGSEGWAWEYVVRIYDGGLRQRDVAVRLLIEDDDAAKRIAGMKAGLSGIRAHGECEIYVISRHVVLAKESGSQSGHFT